jgi:hypothetical protein
MDSGSRSFKPGLYFSTELKGIATCSESFRRFAFAAAAAEAGVGGFVGRLKAGLAGGSVDGAMAAALRFFAGGPMVDPTRIPTKCGGFKRQESGQSLVELEAFKNYELIGPKKVKGERTKKASDLERDLWLQNNSIRTVLTMVYCLQGQSSTFC